MKLGKGIRHHSSPPAREKRLATCYDVIKSSSHAIPAALHNTYEQLTANSDVSVRYRKSTNLLRLKP
jgi:hypothetical protein